MVSTALAAASIDNRSARVRHRAGCFRLGFGVLADLVKLESSHADVFTQLGHGLLDQLIDRLLVVLDPNLVKQADLRVEGVELAIKDLFDDVGGLAFNLGAIHRSEER